MSTAIQKLPSLLAQLEDHYQELYRSLHQNPELSKQEKETSVFIEQELRRIGGFTVRTGIGGTGVVGILENGPGKVVLLRAELDALPVKEATGLPYSSTKTAIDARSGLDVPVMHACGHDMHMTSLLFAAQILTELKQHWSGTLIALFQPSEEDGLGAQAMVDDGLYDPARHAVPHPDAILAGHLMPDRAGRVRTRVGVMNGAVHSLQVTLFGRGGHGARPHNTVDPVVVSSSIVMKLQTIVSRMVAPTDSAVVTVGSLQAGRTENVIGNEAVLKINIRALRVTTLEKVIDAVHRIIEGECQIFGCPKPPTFELIGRFPLLLNDTDLTESVVTRFSEYFGSDYASEDLPSLGAEDLCNLATKQSKCCFWNIGCIEPTHWDDAVANNSLETISGNHSAGFAPIIQPTLSTATKALVVAAVVAFE